MVSDSTATADDGDVLLTASLVNGLAGGDITYAASGDFAGGITVWSGSGADAINVDGTRHDAGVRTATALHTGAGDDRVSIDLGATDGFFVANAQVGDDAIDAAVRRVRSSCSAAPAATRSPAAAPAT